MGFVCSLAAQDFSWNIWVLVWYTNAREETELAEVQCEDDIIARSQWPWLYLPQVEIIVAVKVVGGYS